MTHFRVRSTAEFTIKDTPQVLFNFTIIARYHDITGITYTVFIKPVPLKDYKRLDEFYVHRGIKQEVLNLMKL